MIIDHDLHIHTNLSSCSNDPDAIPSKIIKKARKNGLKTIGFCDHFWDETVPGASKWYKGQDFAHVSLIRNQIPRDKEGIDVLIGCETEYCGGGKIGISKARVEEFDYVLVPISHFHMKGFVVPDTNLSFEDMANLLVERFIEVLQLDIATAIPHPFYPVGYTQYVDEILSYVEDNAFYDCFNMAADKKVGIEVSNVMFPGSRGKKYDGFHDETFLRILSIARECGCMFYFGSDAHELDSIGLVKNLGPYAQRIGIAEKQLMLNIL